MILGMERIETNRPPSKIFPQVTIRQLIEKDLPQLEWDGEYTHYRNLFRDAFERARKGSSVLWVAEIIPHQIIGQVFIQLVSDRKELADGIERAYLYSFRVRSDWRNMGIGSRMLGTLEYDLRRRGYRSLTLNVAMDNLNAQRLYLRKGFRITGSDPGIWSFQDHLGVWHRVEEPAYRMLKVLR